MLDGNEEEITVIVRDGVHWIGMEYTELLFHILMYETCQTVTNGCVGES